MSLTYRVLLVAVCCQVLFHRHLTSDLIDHEVLLGQVVLNEGVAHLVVGCLRAHNTQPWGQYGTRSHSFYSVSHKYNDSISLTTQKMNRQLPDNKYSNNCCCLLVSANFFSAKYVVCWCQQQMLLFVGVCKKLCFLLVSATNVVVCWCQQNMLLFVGVSKNCCCLLVSANFFWFTGISKTNCWCPKP